MHNYNIEDTELVTIFVSTFITFQNNNSFT